MDKMITTSKDTTISNDGATILKLLDIEHPAAKILVDIAKSQDNEVGDGYLSLNAARLLSPFWPENCSRTQKVLSRMV
jgi:chaperonin GroEL (HSP60 family)